MLERVSERAAAGLTHLGQIGAAPFLQGHFVTTIAGASLCAMILNDQHFPSVALGRGRVEGKERSKPAHPIHFCASRSPTLERSQLPGDLVCSVVAAVAHENDDRD